MDEKAISEQLTAIEILEKVWRWLVLVSFLGAGTIFIIDIDFQLLMGLIIIFEGVMNFFRIFNLSKKYDTSYVKSKLDKRGIFSKIWVTKPHQGESSHAKYINS
jgi:hypothetical protein